MRYRRRFSRRRFHYGSRYRRRFRMHRGMRRGRRMYIAGQRY